MGQSHMPRIAKQRQAQPHLRGKQAKHRHDTPSKLDKHSKATWRYDDVFQFRNYRTSEFNNGGTHL